MPSIERAVLIRASCQKVFGFISDFRNDGQWRRFVQNVEHDPPGLAWLGTRIRETILIFGIRLKSEGELIEYEQDRWVATRAVSGALGISMRREVDRHGEQCRCTVRLEIRPGGLARIPGHLFEVILRRRLGMELPRLREILEQPGAARGRESPVAIPPKHVP